MPRGKRYIVSGQIYHVTHRCHNKAFLLRFKKDRSAYRKMLWERLDQQSTSLLSYCITSNHIHLLLKLRPGVSDALDTLSSLMQGLQGDFSKRYNRRKRRENAFWGDRYHATMIDSGTYLWRCLVYIDLNMVRAGVVKHPQDWEWTAYRELMGGRGRYRLVDMPTLLEHLAAKSEEAFRENYGHCIDEALGHANVRDPKWTESLAVGSESFVEQVGGQIRHRMKVDLQEDQREKSVWLVRESPSSAYGLFSGSKTSSNGNNPACCLRNSLML